MPITFYHDRFADGVGVGEKLFLQVVADHRHHGALPVFQIADETAF